MDPLSLRIGWAYAADWLIGDPRWLPHPVRGLGWLIRKGEDRLRHWVTNERLAGGLLVAGICAVTLGVSSGVIWAAGRIHAGFAAAVEVILLFFCLSTQDLAVESWPVYKALRAGDLSEARRKMSWLVGRDTQNLSEPEVVRAAVETIGESTMDGIVAPLFYAALGGAPLACLYKAVNTLDSMVGFRSARYIRFGAPAAVLDRWMNRIPAHLTALLLALAGQLRGGRGLESLRAGYRDGWPSRENSYLTEGAIAGAIGVQVGGVNFYQGVAVPMPVMGRPHRPLTPDRIPASLQVMALASVLGVLIFVTIREGLLR